MTIANQVSAEIATALLLNRKGDPAELLRIVKTCHSALRGLSYRELLDPREQTGKLVRQNQAAPIRQQR